MAPIVPPVLIKHLREGRCVLFVGSGLSAWGKLPTWRELLKLVVEELRGEDPNRPDLKELNDLIDAGKLLEVADYCKEKLGPPRLSKFLSEQLRGDTGDVPEPHKIIMGLPFAAIVTTNYDKLLESAYAAVVGGIPKAPTHRDILVLGTLLFDKARFILKAHGDIDRPDTLVLTARDYQEIIHANPAFNEFFSALLMNYAVLFVGYSLSDPDFRLLLDRQLTVFKGDVPARYVLMSGVSSVEKDVLWRTAGIKLISYADGQHEEVLQFFKDLQSQVGEGAEPSAAQVREIFPAPSVPAGKRPHSVSNTTVSISFVESELHAALETDGRVIAQGTGLFKHWSALRVAVSSGPTMRFSSGGSSTRAKVEAELTKCLPTNVLQALQAIPDSEVVTLRLDPEVETLPWEWIQVEGAHLCLRNPVVRAPIGVPDTARGYPMVNQPARVLLIGDTSEKVPLAGARVEVEEIAKLHRKAGNAVVPLIGSEADFDGVVRQLLTGNHDVIHFAGHAWYDEQEAYLMLHDEVTLRASALRSLLSPRPPALLFLNSHYTAFIPLGERLEKAPTLGPADLSAQLLSAARGRRGFTGMAMSTGVGAFVGCMGSPSDEGAKRIGVDVHRELIKGVPVAVALHRARVNNRSESDGSWALFTLSGYPELVLK